MYPVSSKSPRRVSEARGSDEHLTADQRLDQLQSESNRLRSPREREQVVGMNLDELAKTTTVSPSMATKMKSPPRELTRTLIVIPQDIPITDITSDETGRDAFGLGRNLSSRESTLSQEVVTLIQKRLTSEFKMAEMNNYKVEAEIHHQYLEQELSQEVHMFNQARILIEEMRRNFTIEDQGCVRRTEV